MTHVNKLYGYLTDGDNTERKTTTSLADLNKDVQAVVRILIPDGLDDSTRRGLAELYIRLCFSDKTMAGALQAVDPLNSYRLHSFTDTIDSGFEIASIVADIRKSTIPDLENSALAVDYILCALRHLLKLLKNV